MHAPADSSPCILWRLYWSTSSVTTTLDCPLSSSRLEDPKAGPLVSPTWSTAQRRLSFDKGLLRHKGWNVGISMYQLEASLELINSKKPSSFIQAFSNLKQCFLWKTKSDVLLNRSGRWSETDEIKVESVEAGKHWNHKDVANALSSRSWNQLEDPLPHSQVYLAPLKWISFKEQSTIACLKPPNSQLGWGTEPLLSALERRSLKSLTIHQGKECCCANNLLKSHKSFRRDLSGKP